MNMTRTVFSILFPFILLSIAPGASSCGGSEEPTGFDSAQLSRDHPWNLSHAEQIVGGYVHMSETGSFNANYKFGFNKTFTADTVDPLGRLGNVYFMYQEFLELDSAISAYAAIRSSNSDHEGVEDIADLGDEAYFHSDGESFYFIMVRKGTKELRIKLNKITSGATKENFISVAREITESM